MYYHLSVTVCALIATLFLSIRADATEGVSAQGENHQERADKVFQVWTDHYGLETDAGPPRRIQLPSRGSIWKHAEGDKAPWAPHLEDCNEETQTRIASETRGEHGSNPAWLQEPARPPWIKGGDADNLPLTRMVQADIWQHQFPMNCSDEKHKFALVKWTSARSHGFGSQIHVLAGVFNVILAYGRILVPYPKTFTRADHAGCKNSNLGSLDCYFFPMASKACEERAMDLLQKYPAPEINVTTVWSVLGTEAPVVVIDGWQVLIRNNDSFSKWGEPWKDSYPVIEQLGATVSLDQRLWWRSQAVRFILRWPSAYLCHLLNRARHESFGRHAASRVALAEAGMSFAANMSSTASEQEHKILKRIDLTRSPLEKTLWKQSQPYLPRPILHMHVRLGDKSREMHLFSLHAHMWLAERLRLHVPNLQNIWLTTEVQSVIDEVKVYSGWKFFYSSESRGDGSADFHHYERQGAARATMEGSYIVNLLLASECDYFVGALGSNGPQLVNELRLTSGKLSGGFLSLNSQRW